MENQRIFLWAALGFISLLLYQTWMLDYGPKPEPVTEEGVTSTGGLPATNGGSGILPSIDGDSAADSGATAVIAKTESGAVRGQLLSVETDVALIEVDTVGGTIASVRLKDYPVSIDEPETPFVLVSNKPSKFLIAQSGLNPDATKTSAVLPAHTELFTSEADSYALTEGQDALVIPLTWSKDGVEVTKTLTFHRSSYEIDVGFNITNNSGNPLTFSHYYRLERKPVTSDETSQLVRTYTGAVISTDEERYQKVDFGDIENEKLLVNTTGGWIAMIQHYFGAAWIPSQSVKTVFFSEHVRGAQLTQDHYVIAMNSAWVDLADGASTEVGAKAFIGPKVQDMLKEAAPHLELSVDFGWLTILAQPLFWLLKKIHSFLGNWGWAIVVLTCLIKAFFYPLSQAGYKSMARMKKLQPEMQSIKERYGDDRAKVGQATMELYKKKKVNPLGGCFPMLIQIPVFIALYWMLIESVELRQAPWILWIKDLADKDPFFILPVIMGITMFIQQKLNPAPADPIQAKVFMMLPFVFTIFFAFFPAGLVLYWIVNNTLSIAQQYYITHHVIGLEK